jgi:3'(2'), 5'-bisphosphate nucleotidase
VGVKIGRLVQRLADVYLEPGGFTHAWDLCSPEAVLTGAGGRMTDLSGRPLVYDRDHPANRRGVVATNGACHGHVITAISPVVHAAQLL